MKKGNVSSACDDLLENGLKNIINKGFYNTSIKEIVDDSNVPKGSFYYYFPNKESFCCNVIKQYCNCDYHGCYQVLRNTSLSPVLRLRRYFECLIEFYEKNDFTQGCLLGNLSLEMADTSDVIKQQLKISFSKWEQDVCEILLESIKIGEISSSINASSLASFCINSWEGALVRMKTEKSIVPLQIFINTIFKQFLCSKHT